MIEKAVELGERNKRIPAWIRAVIILPCIGLAVWLIIYLDGVYGYVIDLQVSWFDGYYLILTGLMTLLVYLFILFVCLLPGALLVNITARLFFKEKKTEPTDLPMSERSTYK